MRTRYVIVTPCRDEAAFGRRTLDSVTRQSVLPQAWVIVDDGSTDGTSELLAEYAARHSFIHVVRRDDRGARSVGPGVIDAFYAGHAAIGDRDYDFLCKLDLDLELPADYFERLLRKMHEEPRLGTCSGKPYYTSASGALLPEACGDENSVGASKFYRRECFEQIGGFVREVMWDGIDCHRCRMHGWIARSFEDPELRFLHLRPMGSSHKGIWTGRKRHGYGQWFMGTGMLYLTASALFRMAKPPLLVGGLGIWWGYVASCLTRRRRYPDLEFRQFLRRYQWNCLLLGKRRATARYDRRGAALWQSIQRAQVADGGH